MLKKPTQQQRIKEAVIEFCYLKEPCLDVAEELSKHIAVSLLSPVSRRIYDALTHSPQSVSEIACELDMSLNNVSAILHRLSIETTLVSFNRIGKNKRWYKS